MEKITAVLVVTYNRVNLLKENIEALLNQTRNDLDIYIVDNASSDGTAELVEKYMENNSNIFYYNTGSNLGGAGGFSYGLRIIYRKNYRYCWIMDDDTVPMEKAYESLVNKAQILKDEFSFLCSYVKWTDGKLCRMNIPGVKRELFSKFDLLENHLLFVKTASFVSLFVNMDIAKRVGLPIKEFFIYGDDCEYTLRLSKVKNGYWDFDSVVVHKMARNANVDIATESIDRLDRHYYNVRNLTYIAKKYGWDGILVFLLRTIGDFIRVILLSKSCKLKRLAIICKGFFAGIIFNPKIEK